MCEAQQGAGVVPLRAIQEEEPASPACSVSSDCEWGPYKRSEGQGWSVVLRQSRRGFKCHAIIDALLPVSPSAAYDILIDPEIKQWRGVKVCVPQQLRHQTGFSSVQILLYTMTVWHAVAATRPALCKQYGEPLQICSFIAQGPSHQAMLKLLACEGSIPQNEVAEPGTALQECTYRKVWEDDGNTQRVEIEQTAMVFFKTIYTRMHVLQASPTRLSTHMPVQDPACFTTCVISCLISWPTICNPLSPWSGIERLIVLESSSRPHSMQSVEARGE